MSSEAPTWRDRYPERVTCVRCLEVQDQEHLDRLLWCEHCRANARNRAGWWGWMGGVLIGGALALYVWLVIEPTVLVGGWVGIVLAATWMGSKVAREIVYGIMRYKNARAVEARPPGSSSSDIDTE